MSPSRVIPTQAETDLPTFTVLVEGEDIGGNFGIMGIMVSKSVNRIPKARIVLGDGDVAGGDFKISSSDVFLPGKEVEIKGGYHNIEDTVFKGIIIGHSIKARENKNSILQIDLRDPSVKMTVGRQNRYFEEVNDSEVIEELINEYGLDNEVEETTVQHREMVQYYTTDWDFMIARADVNGKLVFVDDGKIEVKKPDLGQEPILNLAYGDNVISFEAGMDARDQYSASNSHSWNYTRQEMIEEEGEDPGLNEQGNVPAGDLAEVIGLESWRQQHSGKVEDTELKAWSDSKMLKSRLAKVKGRVRITGFSDIKPGHVIQLEGFGDRFDGPAFVSSIHHHKSADEAWHTDIEFGLEQEWFINKYDDIVARQASGLVPPIHGLQIGVVTNLHEDPDGEDRIKVRMPVIDPQNEGVWARMISLDAGDGRGIVFRPEVGDEVIVGCVNDDPRDPVILGMVHSSEYPSPLPAEEENNEKGIVTRSELKLMFDDDKKSITVETPDGNKWVLSDDESVIRIEDSNGNKISLTEDGISIESAGDLSLKASGDVTIEGTNISGSATASFKADGGSGAELTSNGQTVVKGSLVSIN
ncbi:MAG: type VI secretion system tip protein VgrG [Balneolaceae bacterium]